MSTWLLLGSLAGLGHAGALWRSTRDRRPHGAAVRLILVGGVLVLGAVAQHILPVAAGWGGGLVVGSGVLYARSRLWAR